MADHESEYENFLIENTFILTKYIYAEDFYDYLTSKHVLSSDDKELIDCRHSNPTRRQRAGKLLELLQKKGYEGFRHFMDYLEWEYSHVYEIVTKKKARDPPCNYHPQTLEHKRRSRDLWLMDTLTPTMMTEQLQKCFKQNQGLQITLDEFTRVLKIGQDEKKDLEKGMENIRNKFERSEKENADLHRALSSCLKEIDHLKDDKTVLYQDTIQARTECQNYRDRWAQVQMEKDDLIKQLQDAKDMLAEMECAGKPHRISEPGLPKLPPKPPHDILAKFLKEVKSEKNPNPPNRSETNFQAKLCILEHDLQEEKQKNEELMEQYEQLRSELDEKERELRKANKTIARHDQQFQNLQNSLDDAKVQRERYYQNILTLEEEKIKLESSRSEEHKKYREEITKTSDLFKANHQLKAELDEYKEKCYRLELQLRTSFRDSGELPSDDLSESAENIPDVEDRTYQFVKQIGGEYSMIKSSTLPVIIAGVQSKEEPMISPNMKTALTNRIFETEFKPMKPLGPTISTKAIAGSINEKLDPGKHRLHFGSYKRSYDLNHPHLRQQLGDGDEVQSISSHESSEAEKEYPGPILFAAYKVLFPFYQDSDTGGNAVSVKVRPSALSDIKIMGGNFTGVFICQAKGIPELKEGDKLKNIIITAGGLSDRERDFEGCTLEEAYKMILQEEHFSEGYSQREVTLTIVRNEKYYRTACQWMTENNKTGDYVFVRCAQSNYGLNRGDILLIRDTRDESKKWRGYSLNRESGEKVGEERQLMNYRDAQMGIIKQNSNDESSSKQRKKKAFRTRDFYERVLPMKACHKMPVKLFGHNEILDAILHIMNENSTMFIAKTGEGKKHIDVTDLRQDKHIMISDSEDYSISTRKIQFINVYIEVDIGERKKAQILGNILNLNLQVGYADISDNAISKKEYLTRSGRSYEVLVVSNSSITDKRTLVRALESTVEKAQDQLLWLSESEMDSSEAEKYIRFLGHSTNSSSGRSSIESTPDCVYTQQEPSNPP